MVVYREKVSGFVNEVSCRLEEAVFVVRGFGLGAPQPPARWEGWKRVVSIVTVGWLQLFLLAGVLDTCSSWREADCCHSPSLQNELPAAAGPYP